MIGTTFDGIARAIAGVAPRQRVLAAIGAALSASLLRRSRAQLPLPSCGAEGDVCTHLMG